MKYFKRSLLDGLRDENDQDWMKAIEDYREYLAEVMDKLPEEVQDYEMEGFHDHAVVDISFRPDEEEVTIKLGNGQVITYRRVTQFSYSGSSVSEQEPNVWLYDELELLPNALIEFRLLLEDGEVDILAASVHMNQ